MNTPRCYTTEQLLEFLHLKKSAFTALKRQGKIPFLEELKPRIGRRCLYRADLVDRYLAGEWGRSRSFGSHRKIK